MSMKWEAELTHQRLGWRVRFHQTWRGAAPVGLRPVAVELTVSPSRLTRQGAERMARRRLRRLNAPPAPSVRVTGD